MRPTLLLAVLLIILSTLPGSAHAGEPGLPQGRIWGEWVVPGLSSTVVENPPALVAVGDAGLTIEGTRNLQVEGLRVELEPWATFQLRIASSGEVTLSNLTINASRSRLANPIRIIVEGSTMVRIVNLSVIGATAQVVIERSGGVLLEGGDYDIISVRGSTLILVEGAGARAVVARDTQLLALRGSSSQRIVYRGPGVLIVSASSVDTIEYDGSAGNGSLGAVALSGSRIHDLTVRWAQAFYASNLTIKASSTASPVGRVAIERVEKAVVTGVAPGEGVNATLSALFTGTLIVHNTSLNSISTYNTSNIILWNVSVEGSTLDQSLLDLREASRVTAYNITVSDTSWDAWSTISSRHPALEVSLRPGGRAVVLASRITGYLAFEARGGEGSKLDVAGSQLTVGRRLLYAENLDVLLAGNTIVDGGVDPAGTSLIELDGTALSMIFNNVTVRRSFLFKGKTWPAEGNESIVGVVLNALYASPRFTGPLSWNPPGPINVSLNWTPRTGDAYRGNYYNWSRGDRVVLAGTVDTSPLAQPPRSDIVGTPLVIAVLTDGRLGARLGEPWYGLAVAPIVGVSSLGLGNATIELEPWSAGGSPVLRFPGINGSTSLRIDSEAGVVYVGLEAKPRPAPLAIRVMLRTSDRGNAANGVIAEADRLESGTVCLRYVATPLPLGRAASYYYDLIEGEGVVSFVLSTPSSPNGRLVTFRLAPYTSVPRLVQGLPVRGGWASLLVALESVEGDTGVCLVVLIHGAPVNLEKIVERLNASGILLSVKEASVVYSAVIAKGPSAPEHAADTGEGVVAAILLAPLLVAPAVTLLTKRVGVGQG